MEIISQAKKIMHRYDIEQKTKKISQMNLNREQIDKLKNLKKINNNIESLDVFFMNTIFDFKSRAMCESSEIKA